MLVSGQFVVCISGKSPGAFLDYCLSFWSDDFFGTSVEFCMLDKPISVGKSGTTLSATVGLFSLENRKYMFLKCDIFLLFTKLEKENLKNNIWAIFNRINFS